MEVRHHMYAAVHQSYNMSQIILERIIHDHFKCVPILAVLAAGSFTNCFRALCSFFSEYSSVITSRSQ